MPDEDGYISFEEFHDGSYAAFEGDLGEKLRPLAGFGRELEPVEEIWDGVTFTPDPAATTRDEFFTVYSIDWGKYV